MVPAQKPFINRRFLGGNLLLGRASLASQVTVGDPFHPLSSLGFGKARRVFPACFAPTDGLIVAKQDLLGPICLEALCCACPNRLITVF